MKNERKNVLECIGGFTLEGRFLGFKFVFLSVRKTSGKGCLLHVTIPRRAASPWKSIYALIHLSGVACVRQGMKMLDPGRFVSQCPPLTLTFCYLISVEHLLVMGSPPDAPPLAAASPPPTAGSRSVPALVIDPYGPCGYIQCQAEQNHH